MINILIDELPNVVEIGGAKYDINSDFRTSILFTEMINDDTLSEEEKLINTLNLYYYPQDIPREHIQEAIDKAIWFYSCDKKTKQGKGKGKKQDKLIYSFEEDSESIFAAFMHDYGIDLNEKEYLHWWKFKALFKSLHKENEIMEIMSYRAVDLSKIKDKDQKAHYKEMQELYRIEKPVPDEELERLEKVREMLRK